MVINYIRLWGTVMEEYTLYLDESKNFDGTYFTVSGIIVKNMDIESLNNAILEAKRCIWSDEYIENNHPVLHCVELTTIKNCRWNTKYLSSYIKHYPHYSILQNEKATIIKSKYDNVYSKLCKTLKDINGIIIGCIIDINKFKYLYGDDFKIDSELFFEVAMQETIENYAHFLHKNNAIGCIVYESRNNDTAQSNRSPDFKMYNNFCKIKANNKGISFINQDMISKTIRYMNIFNKKEDVAGLQFADFIAYNIASQKSLFDNENRTEFQKKIYERLYNGNFVITEKDLRSYFGIKYLPYDFEHIKELVSERLKIKNSLDSVKAEKRNLMKQNKNLCNEKDRLIEENKKLKEQIKKLSQNNQIQNG